uniref:Uncharacterized protein n=1 Tax=Arundo donax TaxID=35708 RepID=A0A0A9GVS1_ARUDO
MVVTPNNSSSPNRSHIAQPNQALLPPD